MAVLTENELRSQYLKGQLNEPVLKLPEDVVLTPSAKSYLREKKIEVEFADETLTDKRAGNDDVAENEASTIEKPAYMPVLHSNERVYKDHKRIILRGKLDALEAKIIEVQWQLAERSYYSLLDDLTEVLVFVRKIAHAEATEEAMAEISLLTMDEQTIRDIAREPENHFTPDYRMGVGVVAINALRAAFREAEISAYDAFKREDGSIERDDICAALNCLTSLCTVMMGRFKQGYFKNDKWR